MLGGNCCCGCDIFTDTFTDNSPNANWTVISGVWDNHDTENYMYTADANAIIITANNHPNNEMEHILSGSINGDPDDIVRFIVGYVDTDNYYFGEIQFDDLSGNCGYVALYQRVSGVNTLLNVQVPAGPVPNASNPFQICLSAEEKTLTIKIIDITVSHIFETLPLTGGYKVGFGTSGTAPVDIRIYNTVWSKHYSVANPGCVNCAEATNPTACIILNDYFTGYVIGDNPGCLYIEVTGDWDIEDGNPYNPVLNNRHIECKSTAGILQCTVPEPTFSNKHHLTVLFSLLEPLIEAGAFINYRASNGDRYLGTAELYSDATITFRLYNNGTLIDSDTLLLHFPENVAPPPDFEFSGEVTVWLCLDFDGDVLTFTYRAWDKANSIYQTHKFSMYDTAATGNTEGYYAGLEVVDNQISLTNVPFYQFNFTRHKINNDACYQCDDGCVVVNFPDPPEPVPCYLKLTIDNFAEYIPCNYPYTHDCDGFNGTWYAAYGSFANSGWTTATFQVLWCSITSFLGTFWWKATLLYEYNYDTSSYGWVFKVVLYRAPGNFFPEYYIFEKWFLTVPNIFAWNNEDIPWVGYTYSGPSCIYPSVPPTCKVSYANLDVS